MRVCTSCRRLLRADASHCAADGAQAEVVDGLPEGARLGAYRIDRLLGEGGMGFVYEATHEVLNRRTAIKMLRPELAHQAHVVTRFLNEAKAVNLIDHQHIVNVYDYGDNQDGNVYLVMEFLDGETLDDLMRKRRPMQLPLLLHVFGQVARALAAAHAKHIVHRDLKPANVYVIAREDNPYFVKLLDFGIAQLRGPGAAQGLTLAGSVMGTPQYMSPEQITGGTVDARSDVWAMGVMLYRAVTGRAPFTGEQFAELTYKILHHVPQPVHELAAVPAALSSVIASCLDRRIEARCSSVGALIAGLERVKQEAGLDDGMILAAIGADASAIGESVPAPTGDPTRGSLAGSRPRYQGAGTDQRVLQPIAGAPPRASRRGWYAVVVALVGALGAVGYAVSSDGDPAATAGAPIPVATPAATPDVPVPPGPLRPPGPPEPAPGPASRSIKDAVLAGDTAAARALAERDLRDALAASSLQRQGFAVDALAQARVRAAAPLLYTALRLSPEVRIKAAHALGELGLPEAAPKLRAALAESGERLKVELAAVMYRLGDRDGRAILERAFGDPNQRLTAALALADAGDDAGRAVLADVVEITPVGRAPWRRAAGGLARLGDARARQLLDGELAQSDPARAIGAAEQLAHAGDGKARDVLARIAADRDAARPGDAALALARLGDKRALGWVAAGLASRDAGERTLALAICGALAADAAGHTAAIAALATDDPELRVRLTAEAVLLGL
jgi:eukaryotic-like serine/threonine-protein kinase